MHNFEKKKFSIRFDFTTIGLPALHSTTTPLKYQENTKKKCVVIFKLEFSILTWPISNQPLGNITGHGVMVEIVMQIVYFFQRSRIVYCLDSVWPVHIKKHNRFLLCHVLQIRTMFSAQIPFGDT